MSLIRQAFETVRSEDQAELAKLVSAAKANYVRRPSPSPYLTPLQLEKADETRRTWGGGIRGAKSTVRSLSLSPDLTPPGQAREAGEGGRHQARCPGGRAHLSGSRVYFLRRCIGPARVTSSSDLERLKEDVLHARLGCQLGGLAHRLALAPCRQPALARQEVGVSSSGVDRRSFLMPDLQGVPLQRLASSATSCVRADAP